MTHRKTVLALSICTAALPILVVWRVGAQTGGPPHGQTTALVLGQSLPGLTDAESADFKAGQASFVNTEVRSDGLGPVFNGTSCGECHKAGAVGGAAMDISIARVTRIGGIVNGAYSDLSNLGGPVLQARSLREFDLTCPISGEVVPREANFVSHRITTPLFGAGLIENIPASTILSRVGIKDPDGISGQANMVTNMLTGSVDVGRFGWKAQHSSLEIFAADAYLNEMGITSAIFPNENLPQGRPIPAGWGSVSSPEDQDGDVAKFTNFMRYLAPADRRLPLSPQVNQGEAIFNAIRCSACHTPSMNSGPNVVAALSNRPVKLYSDLLLHRMGPTLADGIQQGQAKGDQFKTAPLWGLSRRVFFMHDGRATDFVSAIQSHGGEATAARNRFQGLRPPDRDALMAFLNSL